MTRQRIPQGLPTWPELNRRAAVESSLVLGEQEAIDTFTASAYGGIEASEHPGDNISNVAWNTLFFDTLSVPEPLHVTPDLGANTMSFGRPGVYAVSVYFSLECNLDNSRSRWFDVRLFDVTTGTPAPTNAQCVIPRSSEVAMFAVSALFNITEAQKDDAWRVEVGNSSGLVSSVNYLRTIWSIFSVGRYYGEF